MTSAAAPLSPTGRACLRRVELFGSNARGDATTESDVDDVVLLDTITHRDRPELYGIGAEVWMG